MNIMYVKSQKFKFKVKSDIDAFKMGHLATNTSKCFLTGIYLLRYKRRGPYFC